MVLQLDVLASQRACLCTVAEDSECSLTPHTARQVGRDVVASPPCSALSQTLSPDPWWPPVRRSYRPVEISTSTYYWIFGLTLSDEEGQG
jgi:hypothetical protein